MKLAKASFLAAGIVLCASAARAIPPLQIYIDGAVFNGGSETWVEGDASFDLWVIGNGAHPDVTLTVSFFGLGGTITLTPTTTGLVTDPSTPGAPSLSGSGAGGHPVLAPHGIFNDANLVLWEDYLLGDFDLNDSPIADFNGDELFPTDFPTNGQINVYEVVITGWGRVHFDAYSSDGSFAPFSHDGEYDEPKVGVEKATWSRIKSLY